MTAPSTGAVEVSAPAGATPGAGPAVAALARRHLVGMARVPAAVIPIIVMPVFFVVAFGGAFGALVRMPGFPTDDVLDWMAPFATLQGAAFAGMGAAFGAGRDLETGFYDRLLLSPVPRRALVLGPLVYSGTRALLPVAVVTPLALLLGASLEDPRGLVALVGAAVGVALVSGLWGLGVAYRTRDQRSAALTQVGIFAAMFLTTGQVPLDVMQGWLATVARYNPMTPVLQLARQGFLGDVTWAHTWPGLLALAGAAAVMAVFAGRGFRRL